MDENLYRLVAILMFARLGRLDCVFDEKNLAECSPRLQRLQDFRFVCPYDLQAFQNFELIGKKNPPRSPVRYRMNNAISAYESGQGFVRLHAREGLPVDHKSRDRRYTLFA